MKTAIRFLTIGACLTLAATSWGATTTLYFRAATVTQTMGDGTPVVMWGFAKDSSAVLNDGVVTVPGPKIELPQGNQDLTIVLKNRLNEPVSIVIPGLGAALGDPVRNPDGRARSLTHEAAPAANATYTWLNVQPGTYLYQSGSHPAVQVQMGLYGALTKLQANNKAYQGANDHNSEATLLFSEVDPVLHDAVAAGDYGPDDVDNEPLGWSTGGTKGTEDVDHNKNGVFDTKAVHSTTGYRARYFLINGAAYDPFAMESFALTGNLTTGRVYHTATLLPNGKVLIAGGSSGAGVLSSAELYDPATGTFTATAGNLTTARYQHTATLLPNGKVLIAGGYTGAARLSSAELYDPATGTFTPTGNMTIERQAPTATLLPNGKVLIVGGYTGAEVLSSAELYDPATGTFTPTDNLTTARFDHTATLLPNGTVLIAGGQGGGSTAELYDPATGTFTPTGNLTTARSSHTATLLPNGKVLIAGGQGGGLSTEELYDPATGTFTPTGNLTTARDTHTATLLPNGKVLIVGGYTRAEVLSSAELYDPATGTFTPTGNLTTARSSHTATLLPNGKVLIAGGYTGAEVLSSAELSIGTAAIPAGNIPNNNAQQNVLLRLLNASLDSHIPILNGDHLKLIAEDGKLYPNSPDSYAPQLAALKTLDAFWKPTRAGTFPLYDRRLDLVNNEAAPGGMLTYLAVSKTTNNAATITIPANGSGAPYPSTINVSGLQGVVSKVSVRLNSFRHPRPQDVDILLVGPANTAASSVLFMSDVGGTTAISSGSPVTLTFDDTATASLTTAPLVTGTYKPTNRAGAADTFVTPAPTSGWGSTLSVFNNTNPNGTWRLYVRDNASGPGGTSGGISGWDLIITPRPQ